MAVEVSAATYSFDGAVSGGSVTLNFASGFGRTVFGQINGRLLTLAIPSQDGSLNLIEFVPSASEDYNAAAKLLQQAADGAAEKSRQSAELVDARNAVDASARDLQDLVDSIVYETETVAEALSQVEAEALNQENAVSALTSAVSDAVSVSLEFGLGSVETCYAVDDVSYAVSDVACYEAAVIYPFNIYADEFLTEEVAAIPEAQRALAAAQVVVPSYVSGETTPSVEEVAAAVTAANEVLSEWDLESTDAPAQAALVTEQAMASAEQIATDLGCA